MKYLGISEGFHDAAWAVVEDGELKFATHSERYTRIKGDKRLPAGFDIKPEEYSIYPIVRVLLKSINKNFTYLN